MVRQAALILLNIHLRMVRSPLKNILHAVLLVMKTEMRKQIQKTGFYIKRHLTFQKENQLL